MTHKARIEPQHTYLAPGDWQRKIQGAYERIQSSITETPLEPISKLAPQTPVRLFFKREDLQRTGSFKLRGATNKILSLTPDEVAHGVIAASNGNHGLGVAAAAAQNGVAAEVFVSTQVSPAKAAGIAQLGARLRHAGSDPLEAELAAREAAQEAGKVFISPYNDYDVMAGQGTIAVELQRQGPPLDAVFVAVGGGGLIGGIGAYLKAASPGTEVVGCWAENSPVLYECIKAGSIVDVAEQPTLSESTAGGLEPGSVTLEVCKTVIDRLALVSEDEILAAMRLVRDSQGWLMEGAAAVALAAFLKDQKRYAGKNVAVVICGGNVSAAVRGKL